MIDIHAHILPAVDDGSYSLEESLRMIKMAQDGGVNTIVATPHCNIPGSFKNFVSAELEERFLRLKQAVKDAGLSVKILRGMEVFATGQTVKHLEAGNVWTLNDTGYVLMEFAFDEDPEFCMMILEDCYDAGFIPVIAHPERYYFVQRDPRIIFDWYVEGYGIQINKGSILGRFGRTSFETARLLLQHGLVSCVASDAHSSHQRTPHMYEAKKFLDEYYGTDYRKLVTEINPARILEGKDLEKLEPIPFDGRFFR
jgi:protein-tyrosine phosphatase